MGCDDIAAITPLSVELPPLDKFMGWSHWLIINRVFPFETFFKGRHVQMSLTILREESSI